MAKTSTAQKPARQTKIRSGRPPKELAGQVDERILDAARQVFLERGFEGASIEEIADTARSGKPTIYARFPNKEALFAAVVMRSILSRIEELKAEVPSGDTIEERGAPLSRSGSARGRGGARARESILGAAARRSCAIGGASKTSRLRTGPPRSHGPSIS